MKQKSVHGYRAASALVLLVGGGAIAIAQWVNGSRGWAIGTSVFYVVMAVTAYVWAGHSGVVAAILRVGTDERQRDLDRDATAITGVVVIVAAIVGSVISIARRGDPGPFGAVCLIAGVTYALSLTILKHRR